MADTGNAPVFRAVHNDDCVAESKLDNSACNALQTALLETSRIAFEVEPREPSTEYRLQIGDLTPVNAGGRAFRHHVEWPNDLYLESARGLADIKVFSRRQDSPNEAWRLRATLLIAVVSSKLSEEAFDAMVRDLTALSSGLLFDLVSKSFAGITKGSAVSKPKLSPHSAQLDLRFLEALVEDLGVTLLEISTQPESGLRAERVVAAWTGSERLSHDAIPWLAARGIDPRARSFGREILVPRLNVVADVSCVEHGVIRWFLQIIRDRAKEYARRAEAERKSIESDKRFRSRRFDNGPSLYELFDQPKIEKLEKAVSRSRSIDRALHGMLALPFLVNQRPVQPREPTPVFRHVGSYHRFWRSMRDYLRRSTLMLEYNLNERTKPTWRMYEQWVFLQIAAACEDIGLTPSSHESLFRRLGTHLFTVDLRRGTRLGFTGRDGRVMLLRYEPWIFSRGLAMRNGDAVFQGREGEAPWSPDLLIEVFEPSIKDRPLRLALAIVIDAKYTKKIQEHHWEDTSKYQMIRGTESGAQVVRQVWVASPAEPIAAGVVTFRDPSLSWSPAGPDSPVSASEFLQGAVSLIPDPKLPRGVVCPAAREFMVGLLAWLQFPEGNTRLRAELEAGS